MTSPLPAQWLVKTLPGAVYYFESHHLIVREEVDEKFIKTALFRTQESMQLFLVWQKTVTFSTLGVESVCVCIVNIYAFAEELINK